MVKNVKCKGCCGTEKTKTHNRKAYTVTGKYHSVFAACAAIRPLRTNSSTAKVARMTKVKKSNTHHAGHNDYLPFCSEIPIISMGILYYTFSDLSRGFDQVFAISPKNPCRASSPPHAATPLARRSVRCKPCAGLAYSWSAASA